MLGYNIQNVKLSRIGNEEITKIDIKLLSKEYDEKTSVYSLVLCAEFDFETSKMNKIEILSGFLINDKSILEGNEHIVSIFAASIFPYLRQALISLTSDARKPVVIPTLDLRYLDIGRGITLHQNK